MKRRFAVAMSAVLAASSVMPVMAESETTTEAATEVATVEEASEEFTPFTKVGEFSITAEGQTIQFSITTERFAEQGANVSASVTLPASFTGAEEDTVYEINDVLRVVSGNFYINVAEISSLVEDATGSSIDSILTLAGIDQDWIEMPLGEIKATKDDYESDLEALNFDELVNPSKDWINELDVQKSDDGSFTITYDAEDMVAVLKDWEASRDKMVEELIAVVGNNDVSMLPGRFSDYFLAIIESINEALPDESTEQIESNLNEMITEDIQDHLASSVLAPFKSRYGESLSEHLQKEIDAGSSISVSMTVNPEGTVTRNVNLVKGSDTYNADFNFENESGKIVVTKNDTEIANVDVNGAILDNGVSFTITDSISQDSITGSITSQDGVTTTDVEAPQAILLRDIVKNVLTYFYVEDESVEEVSTVAVEEESTVAAE